MNFLLGLSLEIVSPAGQHEFLDSAFLFGFRLISLSVDQIVEIGEPVIGRICYGLANQINTFGSLVNVVFAALIEPSANDINLIVDEVFSPLLGVLHTLNVDLREVIPLLVELLVFNLLLHSLDLFVKPIGGRLVDSHGLLTDLSPGLIIPQFPLRFNLRRNILDNIRRLNLSVTMLLDVIVIENLLTLTVLLDVDKIWLSISMALRLIVMFSVLSKFMIFLVFFRVHLLVMIFLFWFGVLFVMIVI